MLLCTGKDGTLRNRSHLLNKFSTYDIIAVPGATIFSLQVLVITTAIPKLSGPPLSPNFQFLFGVFALRYLQCVKRTAQAHPVIFSHKPPPPRVNSYTDEKENKIFLIYKEIQMGSGAKSYMRKGCPLANIWENAQIFHHIWGGRESYMTLHPIHLNFLIYEENFSFFFISVLYRIYLPLSSNDWYRGPTESVQQFAYRGSSHSAQRSCQSYNW